MSAPIELDEEQIERLAAQGCFRTSIAKRFGVSEGTIRTKYKAAFKRGQGRFEIMVSKRMLKEIRAGNTAMIIFALKNYHGMADKPEDQDPNVGTKKSKSTKLKKLMEERGIVVKPKE